MSVCRTAEPLRESFLAGVSTCRAEEFEQRALAEQVEVGGKESSVRYQIRNNVRLECFRDWIACPIARFGNTE